MSAPYVEDWDSCIWAVMQMDHPDHFMHGGWTWQSGEPVICVCRTALFTIDTVPSGGDLL